MSRVANYSCGYLKDIEWGVDILITNDICQRPSPHVIEFLDWDSLDVPVREENGVNISKYFGSKVDTQDAKSSNSVKKPAESNSKKSDEQVKNHISHTIHQLEEYFKPPPGPVNGEEVAEMEDVLDMMFMYLMDETKLNPDLEKELCDLLGLQASHIIQLVLENRTELVKVYKSEYCGGSKGPGAGKDSVAHSNMAAFSSVNSLDKLSKKPSILQSVIIHTAEEKNFKKHIRKLERKANKIVHKLKDDEDENLEVNGEKLSELMCKRVQEENALVLSASNPLFKPDLQIDREKYPFVFDNYAEAKMSAAFIAGHKISLPAGFERTNNQKYEEITIPPCTKISADFLPEFPLTDVERDLDWIGQIAFAGFKKLNKIQSIVYNSACNTHNNLLICAPTGAGKTNIAMLTILRELRRYCDPETRKVRNEIFKIIYLAPMKALASEMVDNFSRRLKPLGIKVRELTGDMQMSPAEVAETHMIVSTPEKWDVVTRKPKGDTELLKLVKLLIIDEVHLLQSDRGPVLEALVARTLRYVESNQEMIRIVGLSATLPNYIDVAHFLCVNPREGLFFFDGRFRPVPLGQTFIGVKSTVSRVQANDMDEICYEKVRDFASRGHQSMVFVHARNSTYRVMNFLKEYAKNTGDAEIFAPEMTPHLSKILSKPSSALINVSFGFAVHHAGLTRQERNLVEKLFKDGSIKVLVCTATLAWGVNLPATAVIIRGTELYDPSAGTYVNLDVLDVMQIFGRAGRPQYDREGFATIITSVEQMRYYLTILTCQFPIESQFMKSLPDNLNAEVVLGTARNIPEAVQWLGYSYFFIRMKKNPLVYGITYDTVANDLQLVHRREELVRHAASELHRVKMMDYDEINGWLEPTDLGRIASHYYIKYRTVEMFNERLNPYLQEDDILNLISSCEEFEGLKSREEEMEELMDLNHNYTCLSIKAELSEREGKVNVLLQSYLSRVKCSATSLISDTLYIVQNATRIARGLFEYMLSRKHASLAHKLLSLCKMIERQMWNFETPFRQLSRNLTYSDITKIEKLGLTVDKIRSENMKTDDLINLMRSETKGPLLKKLAFTLPILDFEATFNPISATVLRVVLSIIPKFDWDESFHGKKSEPFWIWIQDAEKGRIYHHEFLKVMKNNVVKKEPQQITFTIVISETERLPSKYIVHADSDRWLGSDSDKSFPCKLAH
ncbi:activating signal cointegrator 1 complex subunit 3-like [Brevipalpus obovatus]|uniref:activating signal cointegrator 1 complex subunit 3-like n=1 Tax=Brevipalpus obovatus TaxID=246614 RepID=UPI003D9F8C61